MKRLLLLLMILLPGLLTQAQNRSDYDFEVDGIFYKKTSETTCQVYYEAYRMVGMEPYLTKEPRSYYSGDLVIPESVTYEEKKYKVNSIHSSAFYYCEDLLSVVIPPSISGNIGFEGCKKITSIVSFSKSPIATSFMPDLKYAYIHPDAYEASKLSGGKKEPVYSINQTKYLRGYDFSINNVMDGLEILNVNDSQEKITFSDGKYMLRNQAIGGDWPYVYVKVNYKNLEYVLTHALEGRATDNLIKVKTSPSFTQITFEVSNYTDATCGVEYIWGITVYYQGAYNKWKSIGTNQIEGETTSLTLKNLTPGYSSKFYVSVRYCENTNGYDHYAGTSFASQEKPSSFTTKYFNFSLDTDMSNLNNSMVYIKKRDKTFNPTDEKLTLQSSSYDVKEFEGDTLYTSLKPNVRYQVKYEFILPEDGKSYELSNSNYSFTTPVLKVEDMAVDVVSSTEAKLKCSANLIDSENQFGYEWRKIDAPDEIPSKNGFAREREGNIYGVVKNLQPNTYYKARLFYECDGEKFYGDWLGFDTGDFSFFEPEVYSDDAVLADDTVNLSGFVIQGSDEVVQQGFEYWPVENLSRSDNGKMIILATGSKMNVNLGMSELLPNQTYNWNTFVETSKGRYQGEIKSFTTPGSSGIAVVNIDNTDEVEWYVNLTGIYSKTPHKGLNIVIYKSGNVKKILCK